MDHLAPTTRFVLRRLPHWEARGGRYFVTVRCGDSRPKDAVIRLAEIHRSLSAIDPADAGFSSLQRQYFLTMEKYLDAGIGSSPLRNPRAAKVLADAFAHPEDESVTFPHYTIMPNH